MNRRLGAALVRFAAFGGLLAVPAVAGAQLKCVKPTDKEIRSVSFEGNVRFTDDELKLHVLAEPTDRIRKILRKGVGTRRCVQRNLLVTDSLLLTSFYKDQGFPNAKVRDTVQEDGPHWVNIVFHVSEGEADLVDSMTVDGYEGLGLGDDLLRSLKTKVGGRFSLAFIQADVDSIEGRMRNSGYPQGHVTLPVIPTGPRARVRLVAEPGPKTRIGRITVVDTAITGNKPLIAQKSVRQLLTFKEGDLYSEKELTQSQRQLYQLGTFYHAQVSPDSLPAGSLDSVADIRVLVVEDYMRQLSNKTGWGTLDCFQTGEQYTDKAFAHTINRLEMSGQISKVGWAKPTKWPVARDLCRAWLIDDEIASSKLNYNTTIRLTQPASFGGRLDRSFAAYSEVRGAYQAYSRTTLIGGAASLSKLLAEKPSDDVASTRRLVGQASYNLEFGHTDAPPAVLCFIFRACNDAERAQLSGGDRRLATLSTVLSRDWRNSSLVPASGTLARVEGRVSSAWLGSDNDLQFKKGVGDFAWYHHAIKADIIALRVRGGIIGGGSTAGIPAGGAPLVPAQERLYTGGENSVRGFGQNELGPLIYVVDKSTIRIDSTTTPGVSDTSFDTPKRLIPTGGNAMMVWNFEYRIHGPFFGNRLQTILFADGGKVWTHGLDQAVQPYKWTPGVGFRVFSPIGPIQFNIAYNNYRLPLGAVFFDPGTGGKNTELICVSNLKGSSSTECQATYAPALPAATIGRPSTLFRRLKFSIAFPPDY